MKNHDFNTVQVADGSEMELYAAFPEGQGDHPAIIVLQEAFGDMPQLHLTCFIVRSSG